MSSVKRRNPKKRRRQAPGAPPGTLTADPEARQPRIDVITYGPKDVEEEQVQDIGSIRRFLQQRPVVWVNVDGFGDVDTVAELGRAFGLHRLALEDVVHSCQRAKVEEYEDNLFIVARMMEPGLPVRTEQLSIFLGDGFVLTFQEHAGDCLGAVRERIRDGRGRIRQMGADYLAYCLLDAVVDFYFPSMDAFSDEVERLEAQVLSEPTPETVASIHAAKRDLLTIRRAVAPLRETVNSLIRDGHDVISETTRVYLRDCSDHLFQIVEMVETYRELLGGLLDVYLSSVSNRMNDVMKVLTVIATMFIPLTFLAGIYGMNFNSDVSPWNMPELRWYWGYPAFLLVMIAIAGIEVFFFWRKGWIGKGQSTSTKDSDSK